MTELRIPFNRPTIAGRELDLMREAIETGHTSMSGPFTAKAEEFLADAIGAKGVVLTTSCTDALEMSALLLGTKPGDVVVVPSFTFVSTALAFAREGAEIRFCDIDEQTLGLDPNHLETIMDDRVTAVVGVHYAGIGFDLDGVQRELQKWPDATLIEDNAHGLFGSFRNQPLGSFGRMSTLSFHETKNFICGEGGALVLNDAEDVSRAHVLRDKGTNRQAFRDGQVDKYTWLDTGSSFGLSDLLAAYLLGQLEQRDKILGQRRRVAETYKQILSGHVEPHGVTIPEVPDGRTSAHHMFHVLMRDREQRDDMLSGLRNRNIQATFHYVPLHQSDGARRFAEPNAQCPVTESIGGRLLRLPYFNSLGRPDIERVCDAFTDVLNTLNE